MRLDKLDCIIILTLIMASLCSVLYIVFLNFIKEPERISLEQYEHPRPMTKEQALYEVWNLTQEDVDHSVSIWGKK